MVLEILNHNVINYIFAFINYSLIYLHDQDNNDYNTRMIIQPLLIMINIYLRRRDIINEILFHDSRLMKMIIKYYNAQLMRKH